MEIVDSDFVDICYEIQVVEEATLLLVTNLRDKYNIDNRLIIGMLESIKLSLMIEIEEI